MIKFKEWYKLKEEVKKTKPIKNPKAEFKAEDRGSFIQVKKGEVEKND